MDMSFANQVLAAIYLVNHQGQLKHTVHSVAAEIDDEIAQLKLAAMNIHIDTLSEAQQRYLASWQEGT